LGLFEKIMKDEFKGPKCLNTLCDGSSLCLDCVLGSRALFSDYPDVDLADLRKHIERLACPQDSTIYRVGDGRESIYYIRQGLVKLVDYLPNGSMRIVRLLRQNDTFGLEFLLKQGARHTAIALEDTQLCRVPINVMVELEKLHPDVCQGLMLRWQKNLDEADRFITEFSTGSAETRVASLLLFLCEAGDGPCFKRIGRPQVAAITGITVETASRIMADFKRRNILSCATSAGCTCSPDKLRSIIKNV
jgi:CRP/FNR family transcriptional regulator, anaerobic regulatory protein